MKLWKQDIVVVGITLRGPYPDDTFTETIKVSTLPMKCLQTIQACWIAVWSGEQERAVVNCFQGTAEPAYEGYALRLMTGEYLDEDFLGFSGYNEDYEFKKDLPLYLGMNDNLDKHIAELLSYKK